MKTTIEIQREFESLVLQLERLRSINELTSTNAESTERVINKIVDRGNTVIIIEHNVDIIKCADHIIDLGPEGGAAWDKILTKGTPEEVMKNSKGDTAKYLKREYKEYKKLKNATA